MTESLLRLRAVCDATGLSRSAIYRLVAEGRFPKPIHPLGPRTAAWLASEVQNWISERVAASRHGGDDARAA